MQHFLVLSDASKATFRHWGNICKLYRLYIFLREGHHFVLYVLNGEATLWHKLHKLYSFPQWISKQTNTASRSNSSQTMLYGVYGCFMACNVFLTGNSEVSLELQCFTAELITYIVCECDAPECLLQLNGPRLNRGHLCPSLHLDNISPPPSDLFLCISFQINTWLDNSTSLSLSLLLRGATLQPSCRRPIA